MPVRHLLCILLLLLVPAALFAQHGATDTAHATTDTAHAATGAAPDATGHTDTASKASDSSSSVAHGAETEAHKTAHPDESHGTGTHDKTYFGIPGWILKLLNMILFIGVLVYLLRGPVGNAFRERSAAIRQAAEEARERRAKADRLAGDIQARLDQIQIEVQQIRERAEADGERQRRELIAAAEAEAQKILTAARTEVDNRLKHARHELTEYAGQLASERAEAILRERITESDQRNIFERSLREVGETR